MMNSSFLCLKHPDLIDIIDNVNRVFDDPDKIKKEIFDFLSENDFCNEIKIHGKTENMRPESNTMILVFYLGSAVQWRGSITVSIYENKLKYCYFTDVAKSHLENEGINKSDLHDDIDLTVNKKINPDIINTINKVRKKYLSDK